MSVMVEWAWMKIDCKNHLIINKKSFQFKLKSKHFVWLKKISLIRRTNDELFKAPIYLRFTEVMHIDYWSQRHGIFMSFLGNVFVADTMRMWTLSLHLFLNYLFQKKEKT